MILWVWIFFIIKAWVNSSGFLLFHVWVGKFNKDNSMTDKEIRNKVKEILKKNTFQATQSITTLISIIWSRGQKGIHISISGMFSCLHNDSKRHGRNDKKVFEKPFRHAGRRWLCRTHAVLEQVRALMERGFRKEATKMVEALKELISEGRFGEYYNPYSGEGYGAIDFIWSCLVVDMMNMEEGLSSELV